MVRRHSSLGELSVTSIPVDPTEAILTVVASADDAGKPYATAMATMQRARRSEHEELWAQFFVDDAFVDVVRVLEIDQGLEADCLFVARSRIPDLSLDGTTHRARVRFVSAVSRIVPRGTGEAAMGQSVSQATTSENVPSAEAVCEFIATLAKRRPSVRPLAR